MFVTVEDIKDTSGYEVPIETVRIAQLMIESWVGRAEIQVEDAGDRLTLARATMFQAIYMDNNVQNILEQAAIKSMALGETTTVFDTNMFSPFMAPLAIQTCKALSWVGTRTVQTGPMYERYVEPTWEQE